MRFALSIEYDGSQYSGWQRQQSAASVQAEVEAALSKVADQKIDIFCAGRTDAGVHATNQIIHFDCDKSRKLAAWTLGVNAHLPANIAVNWATEVDETFHARFSATARRYRYVICNKAMKPAILQQGLTFVHQPLDEALMHQAAQSLIGELDFTSFRTVHCQSKTPMRNVMHCLVYRHQHYVVIDIKANAFLHHMVRNIVGSLIEVGKQRRPVDWIAEVLACKNRAAAGVTAPANGLYLVSVDYPNHFELPEMVTGPIFL